MAQVLDSSLSGSPEVQAWLNTPEGAQWAEEERCAAARKAVETKALKHADPEQLINALGIVAMGWSGDKEEGTLQREALVMDHGKRRGGRASRKRKSGAQRRQAKRQGLTGAARRLAKKS